jgi:hypothetical protein
LFGRRDILFGRSTVQASSVRTTRTFHLDLPLCRKASNCSKVASIRTSQQYVRMSFSVRPAMEFLSKTQIWEDSYNRLDDVCFRPNALLHKASRAFNVQPSGRQSSWSGRSSFIYGNCVHQFDRPDVSLHSPDAPSLDMEIACS